MTNRLLMLLGAATLVACATQNEAYFQGEPPHIHGIEGGLGVEHGNTGGGQVTLLGEGFGDSAAEVVVYFGSVNATVVEVVDGALVVDVPAGPIEGGAVDVRVATTGGVDVAEGLYLYDVGDFYDRQVAYVVASNYWMSCLGGADDSYNVGCDTFAYVGNSGTDGVSEAYSFAYPRIHSTHFGFYGGTDTSAEWVVEVPGQSTYPRAVEDLRLSLEDSIDENGLPEFALVNADYDGKGWCANIEDLGSWHWGGGDGYEVFSAMAEPGLITGEEANSAGQCEDDQVWYEGDTLRYCATAQFSGDKALEYRADWPVPQSFFTDSDGYPDTPMDVELRMKGAFSRSFELTLPEPIQLQATEGLPEVNGDAGYLWGISDFEACFDDDGDANTTLDETVVSFSWAPSAAEMTTDSDLEEDGENPQIVRGSQTYVRFNVTLASLNWFGLEGFPIRATITVPDTYHYDEETGLSTLELPAWVMYQFPTNEMTTSESSSGGGIGGVGGVGGDETWTFGDSSRTDYGYLQIAIERITEYSLNAKKKLGGDVILAYVTGDMGFYAWTNPVAEGLCGNCLDEDADGWADYLDPDCIDGAEEDGSFDADYPCADGADNDGDGLIDVDDDDCESGDGREGNCGNGHDDDGDGWVDADDGECDDPFGQEDGLDDGDWECTDGADNDGDGWVDNEDPVCTKGTDAEDDTFNAEYECNDGEDNDGHGDADAADPHCLLNGATELLEEPVYAEGTECDDVADNDGDSYVDANDPGCEKAPYWREGDAYADPDDDPELATECYDGVDNDGDGWVDALDGGCVHPTTGDPDGFQDDESADGPSDTCGNGADDDSDGWVDEDDPDCTSFTNEVGFGDTECNNGEDDDGNGDVDAEDGDCDDALDDDEETESTTG